MEDLVKAHRLLYHSTLGLRVITKKKKKGLCLTIFMRASFQISWRGFFFFITLTPRVERYTKSMILKYEPASEPLHISVKKLFSESGGPCLTIFMRASFRISYLRLIDPCITQLKAQGPARTCNESKEEEEEGPCLTIFMRASLRISWRLLFMSCCRLSRYSLN